VEDGLTETIVRIHESGTLILLDEPFWWTSPMNHTFLCPGLASPQADFKGLFRNSDFTIPGSTTISPYEILLQTILSLQRGVKNQICKELNIIARDS
jgi:hypothetical protein